MSEAERYQRLRSHLAFLRLPSATEALPAVLDQARAERRAVDRAVAPAKGDELDEFLVDLGWRKPDVGERFLTLLATAIANGDCHLATPDGGPPAAATTWGWHLDQNGFKARGPRVGWVQGENVYLVPEDAVRDAEKAAAGRGSFRASRTQVARSLYKAGYLASCDLKRQTMAVRRQVSGERMSVWHLRTEVLASAVTNQLKITT